jgi:hypothetical protein
MKKRLGITVLSVTALSLLLTGVIGSASAIQPERPERPERQSFRLPATAKERPDGGYTLGVSTDPVSGKQVEAVAYLHPRHESAKGSSRTSSARNTSSSCYSLLAKGLRWKTAEPWVLDAANTRGLTADFLLSHTGSNIGAWESAAVANIFADGSLASGLSADSTSPDGRNEVLFGGVADPGVIAVTITWGYYSAPLNAREIIEWDQIYDDADFNWSPTGEAEKMDYDNISVHELGHAAGLGHPGGSCVEESMYAYAQLGETKKRSLHKGDITGINQLY